MCSRRERLLENYRVVGPCCHLEQNVQTSFTVEEEWTLMSVEVEVVGIDDERI